jgi:hypothetical protein
MQSKRKIRIETVDSDNYQGYGIDGRYSRERWQEECKKQLMSGGVAEWQSILGRYLQVNNEKKTVINRERPYKWKIIYEDNLKPEEEVSCSDAVVVDLTNHVIDQEIILDGQVFKTDVWISGVTFNKHVSFKNVTFDKRVFFRGVIFNRGVSFNYAYFHHEVSFSDSLFNDITDFRRCRFRGEGTCFKRVEFFSDANFEMAEFDKLAFFDGAVFHQKALFSGEAYVKNDQGKTDKLQTFNYISFSGVHFKNRAVFSNRDFRGTTSFGFYEGQPVTFDLAPLFHNCKLFQGTSFFDAEFKISADDEDAAKAFNTLKHAMSQQQSTRDEQNFIKRELEAERLKAKSGRRVLYWMYKNFADYGFSVKRPIICLFLIPFAVFSGLYGWVISEIKCESILADYCQFNGWLFIKTLQFSFLQSMPPLGLDKTSESIRDTLFEAHSISVVPLVVFQKSIAIACWFLVALALRNLFKMK